MKPANMLLKKMEHVKRAIWRKTPDQIKSYIRYVYYGAQIPFKYPKSLWNFRYVTSAGRKERINYIPPIFSPAISFVCNLRCPNCLYILKDEDVFHGGGFIKVDDFKSVIEKYAKGIHTVFLGGGEPLLHPELDKLIQIVKSKGIFINTSTNGILIHKNLDALKSLNFINVSIDSYDYESFKHARGGTEEQYSRILEGLSLLRDNNIKFMTTFMLSEDNFQEIYKMLKFANNYRPYAVTFHNINPHGSNKYASLTLSNEEVKQVLKDITSKNDYPFDILLPVIFDTDSKHFITAKCPQPWYYCSFDDKGDISYCCHLRHNKEIGNILSDYDFNSESMRKFRRSMSKCEYSKDDCLYCHRRFAGEEYGRYNSKLKEWTLIN